MNLQQATAVSRSRRVDEYFESFLRSRVGQSLLADLRRLSASFAIEIRSQVSRQWHLHVEHGVLMSIARHPDGASCRFTLDEPTFLEIVSGRLAPQRAFFFRRVDIQGDLETGLRVAGVMAQFFQTYPFEPE
jgi:predicted lipid carrier protein YhbT